MAHPVDRKRRSVVFDKLKPHSFWLAKTPGLFFNLPLLLENGALTPGSVIFLARLKSSFDTTSVSRCAVIHLSGVDIPAPKSSETCLRVSPPGKAILTAPFAEFVQSFQSHIHLRSCNECYQKSGIKPQPGACLAHAAPQPLEWGRSNLGDQIQDQAAPPEAISQWVTQIHSSFLMCIKVGDAL